MTGRGPTAHTGGRQAISRFRSPRSTTTRKSSRRNNASDFFDVGQVLLDRRASRTPAPPPFSGMNSIPLASNATHMASKVAGCADFPFSIRVTVAGVTCALRASSPTPYSALRREERWDAVSIRDMKKNSAGRRLLDHTIEIEVFTSLQRRESEVVFSEKAVEPAHKIICGRRVAIADQPDGQGSTEGYIKGSVELGGA